MTGAVLTPTKICSKCGVEYPRTGEYFYAEKTNRDGLRGSCKSCELVIKKAYRATHRHKVRAANVRWRTSHYKEWRTSHKEHLRATGRAYYEEHKERITKRHKAWRQANRDRLNAYNRAWRKSHPRSRSAHDHRRRIRKLEAGGTFTAKQVRRLFDLQKGHCWWCGPGCEVDLTKGYHIDHRVPLSKGGSNNISNIVLACPKCNLSKGAKLPTDFIGRLL